MKYRYNFEDDLSLNQIKYRILKNKGFISFFALISICLSSIISFNQKTFFEGKMYFSGGALSEKFESNSILENLDIDKVNPQVWQILVELNQGQKDHRIRNNEDVIFELSKNPLILKKAYSKVSKYQDNYNYWSKSFSIEDNAQFKSIIFVGDDKNFVIDSLNSLKKEILESKELKMKKKQYSGYNITFFEPSIGPLETTNKFKYIILVTLLGLSIGISLSIFKESFTGIIVDQNIFIKIIPQPLLRNFSKSKNKNWQDGVSLILRAKNIETGINFIPITNNYPKEFDELIKIFENYKKKIDITLPNNISKANSSFPNILVVYPNKITEEDIFIINQDLINSDTNTLGWIYVY